MWVFFLSIFLPICQNVVCDSEVIHIYYANVKQQGVYIIN